MSHPLQNVERDDAGVFPSRPLHFVDTWQAHLKLPWSAMQFTARVLYGQLWHERVDRVSSECPWTRRPALDACLKIDATQRNTSVQIDVSSEFEAVTTPVGISSLRGSALDQHPVHANTRRAHGSIDGNVARLHNARRSPPGYVYRRRVKRSSDLAYSRTCWPGQTGYLSSSPCCARRGCSRLKRTATSTCFLQTFNRSEKTWTPRQSMAAAGGGASSGRCGRCAL